MARRARGTALSKDVAEMRKALAARSKEQRITSDPTGNWVSTRGNRLTYRGEVLERPVAVVVLAYANEYTYYDSEWREDDPQPPACAALAAEHVRDLKPLADSPVRQSDHCYGCSQNEWGSRGVGKACANQWRVCIVPAHEPNSDPALIRVSPSGYRGFETFVDRCDAKYGMEPIACWATLDLMPDLDYPVAVFEEVGLIEDTEVLGAVMEQQAEATRQMLVPGYRFEDYTPPKQRKAAPRKAGGRKR